MNKVILHLTTGDARDQKRLFTQINNIKRELPECEIEVVVHAAAAGMMLNQPGIFAAEIKEHTERKVVFAVCRNSLNALNDGGFIFFHDMLPRNYLEENVPPKQKTWSGDVWKVAVEICGSNMRL